MSKRTIIGLLLAAAGVLAHPGAHADIYRCVEKGGNLLYTDRPCPSGTRTTDVTTAVQVCGSADCLERLEREHQEAQARRRAEREQLELLKEERRRRAEEEARREAIRSRETAEPEPAILVEPPYPWYVVGVPVWTCVGAHCLHRPHRPAHPIVGKPWWQCVSARCFPHPHPHKHRHDSHARDVQPWKK